MRHPEPTRCTTVARNPARAFALAGAFVLLIAGCTRPDDLVVDSARIRDLIPGQDKTVAYLTLTNHSTRPLTLTGAETDVARTVEMHSTRRDGDVLRMRRLTRVDIPPGRTVRFEPGGHHLMLFGVRSLDEHCEIRLILADGSVRSVTFERVAIGSP